MSPTGLPKAWGQRVDGGSSASRISEVGGCLVRGQEGQAGIDRFPAEAADTARHQRAYVIAEAPDDEERSWPGGDAEGSHWSEDERAWQNATFDMMRAQQQHVQQLLNMMREHVRALVENAQKQIIDEQQDRLRLMRETADTLGRAAAA